MNATVTLPAGTETLTVDQDNAGWNINYLDFTSSSGGGGGGGTPPTGGSLGANVIVISPSESVATIASTLNAIGTQQNPNQFGTQRYEILFQPGTYGSAADPLDFQIGYYESVEGLGQNPSQVVINGTIDSWNQCTDGVQTECYATDNFWRSVSNLTINVAGLTGCFAGEEVWAASQASPMRRVEINGNTTLMDYCDGSPDWASGGFIADSELNGTVENGSQQQYITRNTDIGSWTNGVWNQVFCGDPGAPAQSFGSTSVPAGGPEPYTTLGTCPVTQEEPYLYTDSSGNYNVFVPSVRTNSSGPSWASGNTPGTSLSVNSTFYIVNSSSTIAQINAALAAGENLLFTPGVYSYASTINVTKADTKIIGLGFATLIPTAGQTTISVADVGGVNISGLILDAGPVNSPTLLTVGTRGLDREPRVRPGEHRRRLLPGRRRRGRIGNRRLHRQQQQLDPRRHLVLARRPRRRRRFVDLRHRRDRPDRQRQQRDRLRPRRRALPAVRDSLERPGRHGHLLPEREPLRRAEPVRLDVQRHPGRLPGVLHPQQRHHVPGLRHGRSTPTSTSGRLSRARWASKRRPPRASCSTTS